MTSIEAKAAGSAVATGAVRRDLPPALLRVAILGNPNTGKTTLFNRLCGLRHKTSNFPGTTQEARVGLLKSAMDEDGVPIPDVELIDLPGIYSLELDQGEAEICRKVLAGELAPRGEAVAPPDAAIVVLDATNLSRNLLLAGEVLRRRLPTLVLINMIDLARKNGVVVSAESIEHELGCEVLATAGRSGEGCDEIVGRLMRSKVPNRTPPGSQEGLEAWADAVYARSVKQAATPGARASARLTDRLDAVFTHPVAGSVCFVIVMAALFWSIFSLAQVPMNLLSAVFDGDGGLVRAWQPQWLQTALSSGLRGAVMGVFPEGILREFLAEGVVSGIGATVVFLPQICLLFLLISILEDTGYLARAAFVMDRVLRPFGLPGHSFVPLLSSHACALPGIMACRGIPDRRERLATILVAPFMTCSARLPVYVLLTGVLFPASPLMQSVAFIGCYALGMIAAVLSALVARRTILRGASRPMAMELPTYKVPSLRSALIGTYDRALTFLRKAGTNILAICIILWWLGAFPKVSPPAEAVRLREQAAAITAGAASAGLGSASPGEAAASVAADPGDLVAMADRLEASHAKRESFVGRLGRTFEPVFAPIGCDWQLTIGVLTSFAAREVFVSTMAIVVSGTDEGEEDDLLANIRSAKRDDGTSLFNAASAWALLVYYVLAMQCLPTLAVTARESGHVKWALLQLGWMSLLAYIGAAVVHALVAAAP